MATTYASPGVYVEEVDKGTKPIEAQGASTTAFLGITETAPDDYVPGTAVLITSWTQYTNIFGGFTPDAYLPDAVYGYFSNGGSACYVQSLRSLRNGRYAAATVKGTNNKPCFTVKAPHAGPHGNKMQVEIEASGGETAAPAKNDKPAKSESAEKKDEKSDPKAAAKTGSAKSSQPDEFNLVIRYEGNQVVRHDAITIAQLQAWAENKGAMQRKMGGLKVEFANNPATPKAGEYQLDGGQIDSIRPDAFVGDAAERLGLGGLEALDDVGLVVCPDVMAGYDNMTEKQQEAARETIKNVQAAMIAHCEKMRYRFAILDTPPGLNAQQAKAWRQFVNFDSAYAALYYPWIKVADLTGSATSKKIPPSGYVAGVYNRVDGDRGVHKAPANETLRLVTDLEIKLSRGEQDTLNPIGVNCIRTFPNRGIRVWGARTLSSDGSWRYVNVRRLFNVVGSSLDTGLQWVVFEPNDPTLWAKVRRDITAFLRTFWLNGALFGTTPDQAFYVKCDEELNPLEIRDQGKLIIEVGLAPVKPAEFVIIRLSQWAGPNSEA